MEKIKHKIRLAVSSPLKQSKGLGASPVLKLDISPIQTSDNRNIRASRNIDELVSQMR